MLTEIEICNRALQKIGAKSITSFLDENSKESAACSRAYPALRNALQRRYVWNFCKKRASLPASVTPPDGTEFGTKYALPSDYLRMYDVRTRCKYSIEGGFILADASAPLEIVYCGLVTDSTKFDAMFDELLAARVATELCETFRNDNAKKQVFVAEYDRILEEALSSDAMDTYPRLIDDGDWINTR